MRTDEVVYLNGEFVQYDEARVSVEDRGFNFADGIYEVIRLVSGHPFRLEAHLDRFHDGAGFLEIRIDVSRQEIRRTISELARRNRVDDGTVYIQLTRGPARRQHAFPTETRPTLVMITRPFAGRTDAERAGVSAVTAADLRWGLCEVKTIGLLPNVLAQQRASSQRAYEAILVRDARVTEGSRTSVFAVTDGRVQTHPVENILPGITRALIVERLTAEGVDVAEKPVDLASFRAADEIFLTGTTTEVLPVVELDGQPVGDGSPGPLTRLAARLYRDALEDARPD